MEIGIIEAPTVKQLFIEKIAGLIISGQLKPGDKLPSERELASQARISKSAVHFAMAELERLGFVKTNARHGTYVSDYAKDGTIETLSLLVNFSGESFLERKRMEDMLEMRMAIEGKAVERLAETLTKESVALLEEDIQRAEKTAAEKADPHSLALCFFDFHHDICFVSGNFILPLLFNSFRTVTLTYWEHAIRLLGREKCIQLMKDLLKVLKEKNARKSMAFLKQELDMYLTLVSDK